jgi:lipopolysaccharide export system ATP-binding protein
MSELRAVGLKKKYGSRTVVQDASLSLKSGEVVGLLGPNGAGKTTMFYMMVGLIAADGGEIFIDDTNITHLPIHRRAHLGLGYLPQEASIFRRLTVEQNIRAVLELQKLSDDSIHSRLEGLLEDLHITHIRDNPAISLSGGERRRVEMARALATDPRSSAREMFASVNLCRGYPEDHPLPRDRNIGVLKPQCTRDSGYYIINAGSVMAEGKPDEIIYNEGVRKVYLGEHFKL